MGCDVAQQVKRMGRQTRLMPRGLNRAIAQAPRVVEPAKRQTGAAHRVIGPPAMTDDTPCRLTLEVLLTAPVGESSVVLSKFLAAFLFFLLTFIPWALYLVAFRVEVGQPFEYRPLLTFFFALACTGAGFLAMGEFFSSISRSQIGAFILAFVGMLGLLGIFFLKFLVEQKSPGSPWVDVLARLSYIDLWIKSMDGLLVPSYLVVHVSAAIFWLFLTIKVLESRKWR